MPVPLVQMEVQEAPAGVAAFRVVVVVASVDSFHIFMRNPASQTIIE